MTLPEATHEQIVRVGAIRGHLDQVIARAAAEVEAGGELLRRR